MAMKKYTSPAEVTVFTGKEAEVVNDHLAKHGKAVSEFEEQELKDLSDDLEAAREEEAKLVELEKKNDAAAQK